MAPADRKNQFKMLLSDDELEQLRTLAERTGLTASDVLRQYIRRAYQETAAAAPKSKRPRK